MRVSFLNEMDTSLQWYFLNSFQNLRESQDEINYQVVREGLGHGRSDWV